MLGGASKKLNKTINKHLASKISNGVFLKKEANRISGRDTHPLRPCDILPMENNNKQYCHIPTIGGKYVLQSSVGLTSPYFLQLSESLQHRKCGLTSSKRWLTEGVLTMSLLTYPL